MFNCYRYVYIFFFNDTATTEIYTYCHTLSLHDALPIFGNGKDRTRRFGHGADRVEGGEPPANTPAERTLCGVFHGWEDLRRGVEPDADRKSTRLNSSH